ncbi:ABC-F family ATP-binding cassette domain-containing protein [Vibrio mimicus]|uniref:ATP-binding cassette domain-containing protein n=1 Tax=Vibrio mimicus TaxID=674 RepID=UPI0011D9D852|nr:ATP-binding cassette domain-containing protein [Vibrio mimicus]TXZ08314.1 ABC-F family ATP-binding cassette domain-containing protein [Vibrio mimicus]
MPIIHAHQLSYQLESGEWLFHPFDFHFPQGRTAIVGRNGIGKSVLLQLLLDKLKPTSGHVVCHAQVGYYAQHTSDPETDVSLAEFLGVAKALNALRAIEAGSVELQHFDELGEQWDIAETTQALLDELRITLPMDANCRFLSGGQLAALKLKRLFLSNCDALVLDEPSNHLDQIGRQWLIDQLRQENRPVLVVSHDRALLMQMDRIVRITAEGLHWFEGNYAHYQQQWQLQQEAVSRRVTQLHNEQKAIEREIQKSQEKAQKRANQGVKALKSGSQPKILMDMKKNSAEKNRSAALVNAQNQRQRNQQQLQGLQDKLVRESDPKVYLADIGNSKKRTLLSVESYSADGVNHSPLTLLLRQGEHYRLSAPNGGGKSRFLKAVAGLHHQYQGHIQCNAPVVYLDQHYALVDLNQSLLDNLTGFCEGLTVNDARLLLAGIGFRRDTVYRLAKHLSGGEKMKLAMLMVSHVANEPILLLDEPDNHLDLESKQALAKALAHYQGALILVSHDDYFVAEAQVEKCWKLE